MTTYAPHHAHASHAMTDPHAGSRMLPMKDKTLAYIMLLAGFFGFAGIHRFYLGKWLTGLIWFFTGGLVLIGTIIDLFILSGEIDRVNDERGWS